MTDNNKTLVCAGHELASELKADCGAVDVRSVAALLNELASALDVQSARSGVLDAELARYSMPAGEADQRMAESRAVRQALGFGRDADDVAPVDLVERINALAAELKASEANDADARCHVAELEEKCAALKEYAASHVQAIEHWNGWADTEDKIPPLPETPAADAWVNEQRAAGVDMFADFWEENCRHNDTFIGGEAKKFAAQLRGSRV